LSVLFVIVVDSTFALIK